MADGVTSGADCAEVWRAVQYFASRCHGSYGDLANDPLVNVIYVATPHTLLRTHLAVPSGREAGAVRKAFGH